VVVPTYPLQQLQEGVEGWINVGFMVDPKGKPYELTVVDASTDNKGLKKAALDAVEKWTFDPATLNGEPIDSAISRKIVFIIGNGEKGANADFVRAYRSYNKAITSKDKVAADAAMKNLKIKNLYEDAFYGLCQYQYARLWGNEEEQLAGVRRAVAREDTAKYLPKDVFLSALQTELRLEAKTQDFASAILTWHVLQKAGADKATLDELKPGIDQMLVLKTDGRSYKVSGQLVDGSWNYFLFKKRFRIAVSEGHVSQLKLRCDKKYIFFNFDPTLEYRIADKYGSCGLEVVGDSDAKFELIQS
jgi:TonB family protein